MPAPHKLLEQQRWVDQPSRDGAKFRTEMHKKFIYKCVYIMYKCESF